MSSNLACPIDGCGKIINLDGKPLSYDDGDFYTVDAICDCCGASVMVTLEGCAVAVISVSDQALQC